MLVFTVDCAFRAFTGTAAWTLRRQRVGGLRWGADDDFTHGLKGARSGPTFSR